MTQPTLETVLAEILDRGWLVNNLFQLSDGSWQANLRTNLLATEFAYGATPLEALALCIDKLERTVPLIAQSSQSYSISTEAPPALGTILSKFKPQPIVRRI